MDKTLKGFSRLQNEITFHLESKSAKNICLNEELDGNNG